MKDSGNEILNQTKLIDETFKNYFKRMGYIYAEESKITSRIDKSVYYIGSAISVLKPYFLEKRIPNEGVFLVQRAIRTQLLKNIYDERISEWSSYFEAMGILVNYENINKLCQNVWDYFHNELGIKREDMIIKAFSKDTDLIQAWKSIENYPEIEYDSKPETYYRHKYGLQDIRNIWEKF